jgi:UDP-N-acetylglucosamine--N-acetylmuramyl-(pentapeptide) pyrophosphoryl-undecaprenol N-acetylglucosamine transferase
LVEEAGLPFAAIEAGGLRGMGLQSLANAGRLGKGFTQALGLVRRFNPNVALVSGGYVSAPVVAACVGLRIPLVVLTVEIEQGWVNMAAVRVGTAVTASFPPAMEHLPADRTTLTGYPVRDEFLHMDRAQARTSLVLDPDLLAVTVFGGSQGAHHINEALAGALPNLLPEMQILHVCGETDLPALRERQDALPTELRGRYRLFSYVPANEMADLLAVADLAVCRAGAAPLAELPLAGLPALLIPGPFSSQTTNARYLEDQGAAEVILDENLTSDSLQSRALSLLHDPERRTRMAERMGALARPNAAAEIAAVVRRVAGVGRA